MTAKKLRPEQRGFTLVELMIVIAVLSILSALAYPLYTEQVRKARRNDARTALQLVAMAQERFYTLNGQYTTNPGNLDLPVAMRSGTSEEGYYNITLSLVNNSVDSYVLTAAAASGKAQAADTDCSALRLDQFGTRSATGDDTAHCW